jgi:hypothetical protein
MIEHTCLVLEIAVGLVFLWSAAAKAVHPVEFFDALADYGLESPVLAVPVGAALIGLEAAVAFTHLSGWLIGWGIALAIGLLIVFILAVSLSLARGVAVACLCFGTRSGEMASVDTLARLLLLAASEALMAAVWFASHGTGWLLPSALTGQEALAALTGASAMLLMAAWLVEVPECVRRFAPKFSSQRHSAHSRALLGERTGGQHVAQDTQSS